MVRKKKERFRVRAGAQMDLVEKAVCGNSPVKGGLATECHGGFQSNAAL